MSDENKTPKTPVTHVLMVVDMSGSMMPLADDVRGGFNEYLSKLKTDDQMTYRLTVTAFDTEFIPLAVDAELKDVPELTRDNYFPRGMTALNDAIGKTLAEFDAKHGKVRKHERALMVIQTDGAENSSNEFTTDQVKALIAEKDKSDRWGFIFLGAGPDAWQAGGNYGLGHSTLRSAATSRGTRSTYSGLAAASGVFSRGASVGETVAVLGAEDGIEKTA